MTVKKETVPDEPTTATKEDSEAPTDILEMPGHEVIDSEGTEPDAKPEIKSTTKDETPAEENKVEPFIPDWTAPKPRPVEDLPATDAEIKMAKEADIAKSKLIEEIRDFNPDKEALETNDFEKNDSNPRLDKFTVLDPEKKGGAVVYQVTGVDAEGEFKVARRFKEFYALSETLMKNWPGIYIPAIPDKKIFNTTDKEVIEERRALFEKFLKDCAKYDYIIYSKEFKIFTRGTGEVDKELLAIPK